MFEVGTSGRKHETLFIGVLRYAESKKIGNQNVRARVPVHFNDFSKWPPINIFFLAYFTL